MQKVGTPPDEHLAAFPDDERETMLELDRLITEAMPGRSRDMWMEYAAHHDLVRAWLDAIFRD